MDSRGPVGVRARALAAADRLVVREAVVPEDGVVHRPLALCGDGDRLREGVEDDVRDPARRLRVPRRDRGGRAGVDEAAFRGADGDRDERAARRRQIRRREAAHDVEARRASDRERTVEVAVVLRGGALEVDVDRVAGDGHARSDLEQPERRLELVSALEAAVGKIPDRAADDALRVREQLLHRSGDALAPTPGAELGDALLGQPVGGKLRAQVAAALVRVPHARDERVEGRVVEPAWEG